VFLDPPYDQEMRTAGLYAHDDGSASRRAREWALAHGEDERLRIVLAGLEGEHDMPPSWRVVAWKGQPGMARAGNDNRHKERLWLSPRCLARTQGELFGGGA
jgi:hypothetical protein